MGIAEYITEKVFKPRLKTHTCLVIYDPERRYRELCLDLANEKTDIVDATENSLESRQTALRKLKELVNTNSGKDSLLVYVPAKKPLTDDEKLIDPFSIYGECGVSFPNLEGDDFQSLCLQAKPNNTTEIRRLFTENPEPTFAMIDAIGGGISYPQLRATLKAESVTDILLSILAPNEAQTKALADNDSWISEAKALFKATLGLDLKTRAKSVSNIAAELWRFILFSEFIFDLPGEIPSELKSVPVAIPEAKSLVEKICDNLRQNITKRKIYIEKAEEIEGDLKLPQICAALEDLGEKDTFPFEERTFFKRAITGIKTGDVELVNLMMARQKKSVWQGKGESKVQWNLIRSAFALIEICAELEKILPERSRTQSALLDFYIENLYEADSLQREFEQAVSNFFDNDGLMHEVIDQARSKYRRLAEKVQTIFIQHLETAGWTPEGKLDNADVYDKFVGTKLKERGKKVAYFMVDALRYELGVELKKLIADDGLVELQAAYAQLPTITQVGMASLLPDAGKDLFLDQSNNSLVTRLGEFAVSNVRERMNYFRKRLNDRFDEMTLENFVRGKKKISPTAELLVLRSTEIDSQLENNPETTLGLIPQTLTMIRAALYKLKAAGFHEVVIAADHGFFLNAQAEAGDVCVKPAGNWAVCAHDRIMLGEGVSDAHNLIMPAEKLGIRGTFAKGAIPMSMAPYSAGYLYFHGGASLQEAVVPVLTVKLETDKSVDKGNWEVKLTYKNGAKRITTRLPVIDISLYSDDLFAQDSETEILLEAQDESGQVVGEPRLAGEVNPATRTITLKAGDSKQILLQMNPDFEGKFTVKALDPTTLTTYGVLNLQTDYTV